MSATDTQPKLTVNRIQPLPEQLANQIAAGEVVERPASVIKELMENALDAGADAIEVEVEKGGMRLMRIRDDGHGIQKDDLPLALQRHATSKITTLEQLHHVHSMGFRGEALASIGSVSRLSLTSGTGEADMAWTVSAEGSEQVTELLPAPFTRGTLVEVRELFYNTPARRRFLRSEQTEYRHLEEVFKRLALSCMEVAMRLKHNRRQVYQLAPAQSREQQEQRIDRVCGREFIRHARYLEFEHGPYRLHGWIGNPDYSRSQADVQYFYLNRRGIRDKLVNHALRQACQEFIVEGRYPAYVLFLEVPPQSVDVNVHPTKHEVRFHEARMVHDFLVSAVRRALLHGEVDRAPQDYPDAGAAPESSSAAGLHEPTVVEYPSTEPSPMLDVRPLPGQTALIQQGDHYELVHWGHLLQDHYRSQLMQSAPEVRPLLIPQRLEYATADTIALERLINCLQQHHFDISQTGPQGLMVRAMPGCFQSLMLEAFCEQLLSMDSCPDNEQLAALASRHSELSGQGLDAFLQLQLPALWALPEARRGHLLRPVDAELLHGLFAKRGDG